MDGLMKNNIVIYQLEDGKTKIDVRPKDINCLRDCLKLFLVYFRLSLSDVSFEARSVGFQASLVK